MSVQIAVVNNKTIEIDILTYLKEFLYENVSSDLRKQVKNSFIDWVSKNLSDIVTFKTIDKIDWAPAITSAISTIPVSFETETSFSTTKDIYQVIYVIGKDGFNEEDDINEESSITQSNGGRESLNQIGCFASIKHYPVTGKAVIIKVSHNPHEFIDMGWRDIARIIRRRFYDNVILTDGYDTQKRSIQDLNYFCKFIFKKELNDMKHDTIDIIGVKLDVYYEELNDGEVNPIATRFLQKIVRGKVIIKYQQPKLMMTLKQFKRLNVLSFRYADKWKIDNSLDINEYNLSQAISQWQNIKNICQTCGNNLGNKYLHGPLYDQRVCSEKCLN